MKKQSKRLGQLAVEVLGLSSPRGRIIFFVLVSAAIGIGPAKWPISLSVWQHFDLSSPSIGLTRAYRFLLHGDIIGAWQQNKLIFAVIAVGAPLLIKDILQLTSKQAERPRDFENSHAKDAS